MSRDSKARHTCTLLREGEVLHKDLGISLETGYDEIADLPAFTASFFTKQYPVDFEVGDQFQMLLDDGRSADVVVSLTPKIAEGAYMVCFRFLSDLK